MSRAKYKTVKLNGKTANAHRQTFFEAHGYYPVCVDHKDGDTWNNDPENLRPADKSLNGLNRGKQANNLSGFKGVSLCKDTGKWVAKFRRKNLGRFACRLGAYYAYCTASLEYSPEFHHG